MPTMPTTRTLTAVATLLWAGVAAAAAPPPGDRALLIGIDRYADSSLNLQGSVNDVRDMSGLLRDHWGFRPEQIRTLTNEEATRDDILAAVKDWLIGETRPGDRVFFYYSGHGYHAPDRDGDEPDGLDEVLVPHDAAVEDDRADPVIVRNLILDDEFAALFDRLRDRRPILIFDSCHSGTMTRAFDRDADIPAHARTPRFGTASRGSRSISEPMVRSHQTGRAFIEGRGNMIAWTAVSPLQLALIDAETARPQGVFTGRFVRALRQGLADRDGSGRVSHAELLDYLSTESEAYCRRNPRDCRGGLTPTLEVPADMLARDVLTGGQGGSVAEIASEALGHDNVARVVLEILPARRIRLDDEMTFRVTSERTGHLLVLDINARGELTQIFPNRHSDRAGKGAVIAAGRPITVPDAYYGFRFRAAEPVGRGLLIAIVTEDPVSLADVTGRSRSFEPVPEASAYLAALAQRLRETWTRELENRRIAWSMTRLEYEIVR
jgi:hypothetical protein